MLEARGERQGVLRPGVGEGNLRRQRDGTGSDRSKNTSAQLPAFDLLLTCRMEWR
jgi:hypothetical protein